MEALVFLWDFTFMIDSVKKYGNFHRIMIVNKNRKIDEELYYTCFDEIIRVDNIFDKYALSETITEILSKYNIRAIYTAFEDLVEIAGYLREKFNIDGMKEADSNRVRNKILMKKAVARYGIKTANAKIVKSVDDIKSFIDENNYPIIIKPISGSATENTYKIADDASLNDVCARITSSFEPDLKSGKFIVEDFISGDEFECDSIVSDGKVIFSSVGKYLINNIDAVYTDKPLGLIVYPYKSDNEINIRKIKEMNEKAILALNIKNAVCHFEAFVNQEGEVTFGEIGARIGGGYLIGNCIKNAYNMNIYDASIEIELNNRIMPDVKKDGLFTGCVSFPTKKGIISDISKEEDFYDMPGVKQIKILSKIGDYIPDKIHTAKRTGYIIIEDYDYDSLYNKLISAYDKFKLQVQQGEL